MRGFSLGTDGRLLIRQPHLLLIVLPRTPHLRRHYLVRLAPGSVQALAGPHHVLHRWPDGERDHALLSAHLAHGRVNNATTECIGEARGSRESRPGPALLG